MKPESKIEIPRLFRLPAVDIARNYTVLEFKYHLDAQLWTPLLASNLLRLMDEFVEIEEYLYAHHIKKFLDE